MKRLLLLIALTSCVSTIYAQTGKVESSFPTPASYPTGLCFDGKNLWHADRGTDKIYCLDVRTGKVLRSLESPAYWPTGLAWDGKYLWNSDFRGRTDIDEDRDGMIFMIDPKNGDVLRTVQSPTPCPKGLTYDGKYLWTVDDEARRVIRFNPDDGSTIRSFPSPARSPKGITYDGKYLWISDSGTDEIYMVDPETGLVIIIADAPGHSVHGLATNGTNLWAVDANSRIISKLTMDDGVPFVRKDRKLHRHTYRHSVACFGPGKIKSLDVHIALPQNRDNQEIMGEITYSQPPTELVTDQWGQQTAHFSLKNLLPGQRSDIEVTTKVATYNVRYFIYPERVKPLAEIPEQIRSQYLSDDDKYQIHNEVIQSTLHNVLGDERNPYWIMRKLHQFLIGHLYYKMDGAWDTAPTVITNGHGSCSEYTFVYIALCRAAGLPARYVGSTWHREAGVYTDEVFHRWVEVYLPGYGWIPTDPTHGDRELPRDQAFPIGLVRNNALITTQSGGGSSTLEWTYNSNARYVTEPKTNLNTNHYADWDEVEE